MEQWVVESVKSRVEILHIVWIYSYLVLYIKDLSYWGLLYHAAHSLLSQNLITHDKFQTYNGSPYNNNMGL